MCFTCVLINKSVPSPKMLVSSELGLDVDSKHFVEIIDLVMNKIPEDEQLQYLAQVASEMNLEKLRNS